MRYLDNLLVEYEYEDIIDNKAYCLTKILTVREAIEETRQYLLEYIEDAPDEDYLEEFFIIFSANWLQ